MITFINDSYTYLKEILPKEFLLTQADKNKDGELNQLEWNSFVETVSVAEVYLGNEKNWGSFGESDFNRVGEMYLGDENYVMGVGEISENLRKF